MKFIEWFLGLSKAAQKFWAAFLLVVGIFLSVIAIMVALFFKMLWLVLLVSIGSLMAFKGSDYWFEKWFQYDCIWNWILGGDIKETVSSRLGKWYYFGHEPIFKGKFFLLNQIISLWLDRVDKGHIRKSIIPTVGKTVSAQQMIKLSEIEDSLESFSVNI